MPQLHNETDKAQNKRLKAELANERATCATLIEALELALTVVPSDRTAHIEKAGGGYRHVFVRDEIRTALKQANGKGL